MAGPLGTDKGGMRGADDKRTSSKMDTNVGSGSRPGTSRFPIQTSAPMNPRTLDRNPPPSLGGTGTN